MHCLAPDVQTPVQAPALHAIGQAEPLFAHAPAALHICGWLPVEHCFALGVQVPVQFPAPLQTYAQAAPLAQLPVGSQV